MNADDLDWKELAKAVIDRAWLDARATRNNYNRIKARCFLTGTTKEWRDSLEMWCTLAGKNEETEMYRARREFGN
ncbi:MAG: hypothetical protein J6S67_11130 [Methanobrevibacter sp.]|nr:hypothetical protein [Methanobrevibacter sp.]